MQARKPSVFHIKAYTFSRAIPTKPPPSLRQESQREPENIKTKSTHERNSVSQSSQLSTTVFRRHIHKLQSPSLAILNRSRSWKPLSPYVIRYEGKYILLFMSLAEKLSD